MTDAELLAALPGWAFAFALVLCRCSAAIMLLPGLGEVDPPPTIRAGLALAVSMLLVPGVAEMVPAVPVGWGGGGMIAAELLVGASLGWLARLPALALSMAGAVASTMMGLSSVVQPDPALGGQSSTVAKLFGLMAPVLVLSTGMYALPLRALAGSYQLFPPGAVMPAGAIAESIEQAVAASLALALQLSAPFVLAGLVVQVGLGLLARLVPQLQVFTVAVPGQILGGVVLLGLVAAPMVSVWVDATTAAWSLLPGH